MDSSCGWRTGRPCSHHHHHHHHRFFLCPRYPHHHRHHHHHRMLPHCPLHCSLFQSNSHSQICPKFNPLLPSHQNPEPVPFVSSPNNFNLQSSDYNQEAYTSNALVMQEGNEGLEAENDEDFVFVLTDEWKELFAKSEAKRRLAKKQAKKKGKD